MTAGPLVLGNISPRLHDWLLLGRPFPASAKPALRQYAWGRLFFRFNWALQRRLTTARAASKPPYFILGLWRSGTTYLHDLLGAHPALCTPRTWQCMAPAAFGVMGPPKSNSLQTRPMDDFLVGAMSPQEDEFALLMLGGPSVYRGFLDPRRLPELEALLAPEAWSEAWPAEQDLLDFLALVNSIEDPQRRLLLKSPNHSFRMPALLSRFPASHCVWITRDPHAMLQSNLKMWRAMILRYGLVKVPDGVLEHFLTAALNQAALILGELCSMLPPSQLIVLGLETLSAEPVATALGTLGRWGLVRDTAVAQRLKAAANMHPPRLFTAYDAGELSAGTQQALQTLQAAQTAALSTHGL